MNIEQMTQQVLAAISGEIVGVGESKCGGVKATVKGKDGEIILTDLEIQHAISGFSSTLGVAIMEAVNAAIAETQIRMGEAMTAAFPQLGEI